MKWLVISLLTGCAPNIYPGLGGLSPGLSALATRSDTAYCHSLGCYTALQEAKYNKLVFIDPYPRDLYIPYYVKELIVISGRYCKIHANCKVSMYKLSSFPIWDETLGHILICLRVREILNDSSRNIRNCNP